MKVDIVKEGIKIDETPEGVTVSEPYVVTEIPVTDDRPMSEVVEASDLPHMGKPYGKYGIQVVRRSFSSEPGLVNGARAEITYAVPSETEDVTSGEGSKGRLEIRAGTVTEQTVTDVNGDFLQVSYFGTETLVSAISTTRTAEVQKPVFRFTLRRSEDAIPWVKAQRFTGKVNDGPFSGFNEKTLLVLAITNTEANKGLTQEVSYELAMNPDSWRFLAKITIGGRIPPDAEFGNGLELYDVYPTDNFGELGITLDF